MGNEVAESLAGGMLLAVLTGNLQTLTLAI